MNPLQEAHAMMMALTDIVADIPLHKNWEVLRELGKTNVRLMLTLSAITEKDLEGDIAKRLVIAFAECFSLKEEKGNCFPRIMDIFPGPGEVRIRKCLNRLGIKTTEELLGHTGDQLLEVKNFGLSSLNVLRAKLREYGLFLADDKPRN